MTNGNYNVVTSNSKHCSLRVTIESPGSRVSPCQKQLLLMCEVSLCFLQEQFHTADDYGLVALLYDGTIQVVDRQNEVLMLRIDDWISDTERL